MNYSKAISVIENLDKHTDEEIGAAIHSILGMATIMAVKKDSLVNVIRYLFDKCFVVEEKE